MSHPGTTVSELRHEDIDAMVEKGRAVRSEAIRSGYLALSAAIGTRFRSSRRAVTSIKTRQNLSHGSL